MTETPRKMSAVAIYIGRILLGILSMALGVIAGELLHRPEGQLLWLVVGLLVASIAIMAWLVYPRKSEDEYQRHVRLLSATQAGMTVVIAISIIHFIAAVRGEEAIPAYALPGYFSLVFVFLQQIRLGSFELGAK